MPRQVSMQVCTCTHVSHDTSLSEPRKKVEKLMLDKWHCSVKKNGVYGQFSPGQKFITTVFAMVELWKQPRCPTIEEWQDNAVDVNGGVLQPQRR